MPLHHHTLVAWQRADDLFIKLHLLSHKSFPGFERFELGSQLRRAAYSVVANIVEGFSRRQGKDRLHFLNISESSLAEVATASTRRFVWDTFRRQLHRKLRRTSDR